MVDDKLPWTTGFQRRCKAVHPDPVMGGRCDLRRGHGEDIDHALDRGMDNPRWSTRWTDGAGNQVLRPRPRQL